MALKVEGVRESILVKAGEGGRFENTNQNPDGLPYFLMEWAECKKNQNVEITLISTKLKI